MLLLTQFLLRLTFGLAVGMAVTSPRLVTSGYFRNHLYVTLGLATLAAVVSYAAVPEAFWYVIGAAVASYVGSACWLYEKAAAGKVALLVVAIFSVFGAIEISSVQLLTRDDDVMLTRYFSSNASAGTAGELADEYSAVAGRLWGVWTALSIAFSNVSSGLLLGITFAAMLLGHWYLNSPTMELAPLRRLLVAMGIAVAIQSFVSALGLLGELRYADGLTTAWLLFVVLRWCFGLLGVAVLIWMAWQTLKIPNTQSATGILYVAVIGVFVGELTGLLLSAESAFPL
jgi:hypothetical protein